MNVRYLRIDLLTIVTVMQRYRELLQSELCYSNHI